MLLGALAKKSLASNHISGSSSAVDSVTQILEGTNEVMRVIVGRKLMMDGALEVIK